MKIMLGYDGSNASKDALKLAKKHAKAFSAEVNVVTSLTGGGETEEEDIKKAETGLEYVQEVLENDGISCKTHLLVRGFGPGEDIVNFAQEKKIDQIIIGIKRRSKVGKMLFGSNAQYIILNASCPVLTIK